MVCFPITSLFNTLTKLFLYTAFLKILPFLGDRYNNGSPMLRDRCAVCLSCLTVCNVGALTCGQTVRWTDHNATWYGGTR